MNLSLYRRRPLIPMQIVVVEVQQPVSPLYNEDHVHNTQPKQYVTVTSAIPNAVDKANGWMGEWEN